MCFHRRRSSSVEDEEEEEACSLLLSRDEEDCGEDEVSDESRLSPELLSGDDDVFDESRLSLELLPNVDALGRESSSSTRRFSSSSSSLPFGPTGSLTFETSKSQLFIWPNSLCLGLPLRRPIHSRLRAFFAAFAEP